MNINDKKYQSCLDQLASGQRESDLTVGDGKNLDLKSLAKNLMENNRHQFSFLLAGKPKSQHRKIERIYSKGEIRNLVSGHLIPEYQLDQIVDAVTDYLYSMHVAG